MAFSTIQDSAVWFNFDDLIIWVWFQTPRFRNLHAKTHCLFGVACPTLPHIDLTTNILSQLPQIVRLET